MTICKICLCDKLIFFATVKSYKYYFCNKCQTLQLLNHNIKHTYNSNFDYITDSLSIRRIKTNSKSILNYIKKVVKKHASLLDIGSGYGYLLKEAQTKFKYTLGIEPSNNLYKYSENILNVTISNKSFERYYRLNKSKKFDVITMVHVIEHVKNPKQFLSMAIKLLNKDGVLYVETPNLNSWLYRIEQKNYTFLTPPEHLYIFSKDSFRQILKNKLDAKIVKISTYSYVEHAVKVIKEILSKNILKRAKIERKPITFSNNDRVIKQLIYKIKKFAFYVLLHKILGPIILPLLKLGYNGTFLRLYIKKKR